MSRFFLFFGDDQALPLTTIAVFDEKISALNCGAVIAQNSADLQPVPHVYVRDEDGEYTDYFDRMIGDWRDAYAENQWGRDHEKIVDESTKRLAMAHLGGTAEERSKK